MARYWVYLNDAVLGPFALEQLIRQRGFSRQTLVCVDDASGKQTNWISPAEIPELAHIFKAADEQMITSPAPPPVRPAPKPVAPRPPRPYTPAVTLQAPKRDSFSGWVWAGLAALLVGGGAYSWYQMNHKGVLAGERLAAQSLVENARLPSSSPYGTLRQYLQEKDVKPRWEFEKVQDALYHLTTSWYPPAGATGSSVAHAGSTGLVMYAFEANIQAQTVRGLNTAATKLLSEGFTAPSAPKTKPTVAPEPKKTPSELFSEAVDLRRAAIQGGDFPAVWESFSPRKKSEMAHGGISREGFLRVQSLTHRLDTAIQQTILKTKSESDTQRLVLLKQSQAGRPDIFIKQVWIYQEGIWKLDDEQQRAGAAPAAESVSSTVPASSASPVTTPAPSTPKPAAASLPGMSN